jgi:1-deoxy-D-xylulose-5-phosphate reductoisomerase
MDRNIAILGSTGSIGESALDVIRASGGALKAAVLCAGTNAVRLAEQVRQHRPLLAVIADASREEELRRLLDGVPVRIASGVDGVLEAATLKETDIVLSGVVGAAGIVPAYLALDAGKDLALANKETLVAAGEVIMKKARKEGRAVLPVDSEHSAIYQALSGRPKEEVRKIILTASGGPFHHDRERDLWQVTPGDALRHPSWSMGNKVTIDSATLMNKGLEVIEARWLFDMDLDRIEVAVHPQSLVHGVVEFVDGSMLAQLSQPDMRIPIAAALHHPARPSLPWESLDLCAAGRLDFIAPDVERFPALSLARSAQEAGGGKPAALNAANEVAVEAFLGGSIRFPEIIAVTRQVVEKIPAAEGLKTVEEVLAVDAAARTEAAKIIHQLSTAKGAQN